MLKIDKRIKESFKNIEVISNIISQNFYGQREIVHQVLASVLSRGNTLLEGVPGLGKTLLFEILSQSLNLTSKRIQCTPDLMPSDILGAEIFSSKNSNDFVFIKGPIFCNLLMIDEINRASPRTQSALLQAMQEGFISIGNKNYQLPKPFIVLATQNPIEQEGIYNLPEAQLDRFLMHINISYPDEETERKIIMNIKAKNKNNNTFNAKDLINIIEIIDTLPIGKSVLNYALSLIRNLRPETTKFDFVKKYIKWGPGPRGGQALIKIAKSRAFLNGNFSPSISDIINLAKPVLRHRISLNFEAKTEQFKTDYLIQKVCDDLN